MKTNLMRVVVASFMLVGAVARAQYGSEGLRQSQTIWALNWEVAGPIGDFKNYVSDWSLRGFSLEGRYLVTKNISVGGSFSFNRWEQTYNQISVPASVASGIIRTSRSRISPTRKTTSTSSSRRRSV